MILLEQNLTESRFDYSKGRIFLYCIRDVERRLDKVLDSAMLDHEALPGYSDIRFEGEWRFVKALTNRSKKDTFGSVNGSPSSRPSVLGLFGSPDRGAQQQQQQQQQQAESPFHTPSHKNTPQDPVSAGRMRTPSMPAVLRGSMFSSPSTSSQQPPPQIQEEPSPKSVTTILSSTLFILQHYDYAGHPAIIVQAFSQLLYWIASELFNRILTRVSGSLLSKLPSLSFATLEAKKVETPIETLPLSIKSCTNPIKRICT